MQYSLEGHCKSFAEALQKLLRVQHICPIIDNLWRLMAEISLDAFGTSSTCSTRQQTPVRAKLNVMT